MNLGIVSTRRFHMKQDIGVPAIVVRMKALAFVRTTPLKQALRYTHTDSSA